MSEHWKWWAKRALTRMNEKLLHFREEREAFQWHAKHGGEPYITLKVFANQHGLDK